MVVLGGCSGNSEPRLQVWENGVYTPQAIGAYEITGRRDGATTRAEAMLTLEGGKRLHLELEIFYDPTPALASGRWSFDGDKTSGEAHAESVTFLGGQGEGPSLGGRFRLDENGNPRFRVTLPLRPVDQPKWNVE
jgi:hypothetical protein